MIRAARRGFAALARPLLVWLLALICPLQASAALAFAVEGPLHSHRLAARAAVLIDFRRDIAPAVGAESHTVFGLGHFHVHAAAQRHRHAESDASVVRSTADLAGQLASDEGGGLLISLASFLAMISSSNSWQPPAAAHALPMPMLWSASDCTPRRTERPPRCPVR